MLKGPGPFGYAHPGFILAVLFGLIAAVTFISSYFVHEGPHQRNGQAV